MRILNARFQHLKEMFVFNRKILAFGALGLMGAFSQLTTAQESHGFYAGAGIGQNTRKDSSIDFDANDTAFQIFGGYSINEFISAEVSYFDGGSPSQDFFGSEVKVDDSGFTVGFLGKYNFTPQFSLLGRLGVLFWDEKIYLDGAQLAKESGNDLSYGIGAGFNFTPNTMARLEWQSANTQGDFHAIMLSMAFKFKP